MKRILFAAILGLSSICASATTLNPIQLLNPAGSVSGQAIVSTGSATAPAWGGVGLNGIAAIAANTVLANATASSAAPTAFAMPSCSSSVSALNWTTSTGFTCNTGLITAAAVSSTYAPLASPALTGTPTAPTAAAGTNTTQLATTAFVQGINSGRLLNIQTFTASGTYTPTAGTNRIIVEVQASGGGGGGVGATGAGQNAVAQGGSAGTYASVYISGSITSQAVTINNPGAGGAAGINAGGTAGVTSFGTYVSCPGGIGGAGSGAQSTNFVQSGASAPSSATISGVTATLLNIAGGAGSAAVNLSSSAAFFSVGGIAVMGFNTNGGNGMGGNGAAIPASSSATAGQNGVIGKVIVYEYN